MRKPTVLHLIETLTIGGAERLLSRLVLHLREGEYDPVVCSLSDGPLRAELEGRGVPVLTFHIARRSVILLPLFLKDVIKTVIRLIILIRRRKIDIIHAHLPDCAILAGIVGKLSGTAVVATYHGLGIFPSGRNKFDPRNVLRAVFYRLAGKLADRSIAVSDSVRDLLRDSFRIHSSKIVVIYNGAEVSEYERPVDSESVLSEWGLRQDDKIVTCIGRLVWNKGHEVLIRAGQEVVGHYPSARILIVGDGPGRENLRGLVSQLGLGRHVLFLGERSDIPEILAVTQVFVLPSFAEGISMALLEAMAAGKPAVVTAVPGNRDVVVDQETGILVPVQDSSALAEAICNLLADSSLAEKMGALGRLRIKARFDFEKTWRSTERVYDELMRKKGSPRRDHEHSYSDRRASS
ncbi:MAG: glycosyltransferase [Deltaproteobacteria bacterium]|nr:glycosyltransferase [Deltaproteobacteria bacterium]